MWKSNKIFVPKFPANFDELSEEEADKVYEQAVKGMEEHNAAADRAEK